MAKAFTINAQVLSLVHSRAGFGLSFFIWGDGRVKVDTKIVKFVFMKSKKPILRKGRRSRAYDTEFKSNALKLAEQGQSIPSVAESLGIDKGLGYSWHRQADPLSE